MQATSHRRPNKEEQFMIKHDHTVLIIDDDFLNITALTHLLSDEFNIITERNGLKSVETARTLKPDLILLDIVMPEMNGFEVIAALKNDETTKGIPVIFVTGLNNTRDEEQGLLLGAVDYINKPFSGYIVKLRIRNQLQISTQMNTIHESSTKDALTGFVMRDYFNNVSDLEWRKALRGQNGVNFAIFNVDNFKHYNEKYGQQKGDDALKFLATIILERVNLSRDHIVRWNGDEIAVLMHDVSAEKARAICEEIRQAVEAGANSTIQGVHAEFTVSAGTHFVTPWTKADYNMDNLILDTTIALAHAKKIGKNQVITYTEAKEMILR